MKKIELFFVTVLFCLGVAGQVSVTYNGKFFRVSPTSVVKDSAGQQLQYEDWRAMLSNGDYDIRPVDPDNNQTSFLLTRFNKEEQQKRLEAAPKPIESNAFMDKKKISSFSARDMQGIKIDSKELKGKILVLNFWFINCPPCRHERPYLNQLVTDYANDSDVVFVAVALDDKPQLEVFLKENPFAYHVIPNGTGIVNDNAVNQFPTHVIIDKEGKIAFNTVSYNAVTGYWLRKIIDEIRNGK
ncbi:MAG: TlpA disulfide reductase family protein [Bacteroidota bacterium]